MKAHHIVGTYTEELRAAMDLVHMAHPRSIFMGQAVACDGTAMRKTLNHLPPEKLLELPVAEDMQLGMALGMALDGMFPVCIYPRVNFLMLAMNQLVLHLDKLPIYSDYKPRMIIRTAIATDDPLDPGPQHLGNFSYALSQMLQMVEVVDLTEAEQIVPAYSAAIINPWPTMLVERMELYIK